MSVYGRRPGDTLRSWLVDALIGSAIGSAAAVLLFVAGLWAEVRYF